MDPALAPEAQNTALRDPNINLCPRSYLCGVALLLDFPWGPSRRLGLSSRPVSDKLLYFSFSCGLLNQLTIRAHCALYSTCVNLTKSEQLAAGTGWSSSACNWSQGKPFSCKWLADWLPQVSGSTWGFHGLLALVAAALYCTCCRLPPPKCQLP